MQNPVTKTVEALKKITLGDIYQAINDGKKQQHEDFMYLDKKIDSQIGQVRQEMGQLRQEMGQLRQELKQEMAEIRQEIRHINQRIDQLNLRFDTVIDILLKGKKE